MSGSSDPYLYGADGRHAKGWAHFPRIEQLTTLVLLQCEKRRRDGASPEPRDLETRLGLLRFEKWLLAYRADQERQRSAAEALGLEWPPPTGPRPWVWCWEAQYGHPLPVVYPLDWQAAEYPDRYGFGNQWVSGETLVIPVDEQPAEGEIVPSRRRVTIPASRGLPDGIPDAEVVEEAEPDGRRISPSDWAWGTSRVIATIPWDAL